MTIPTPMTFVPGDQASADYNSGIHDPLAFLLTGAPICLAVISSPVTLTALAFTPISFDTVVYDSGGFMSGGTPMCPEDGIYIVGASVRCSPARGTRSCGWSRTRTRRSMRSGLVRRISLMSRRRPFRR